MTYPYTAVTSSRSSRSDRSWNNAVVTWLIAASLCASAMPLATASANPPAPDQLVRHTAESVMQEIRLRNDEFVQQPEKLYWLVEQQLVPHFDIDLISKLVLGRYWEQATPEQRERFATAFQHLLVRQYAKTLLAFQNDSFEWMPVSLPPDGSDVSIKSSIIRSDAPALAVNYRLHLVTDKWLVYDISIDGVSLVTNYRGMFVHEVRTHGLDALISQLEKKISS